MKMISLAQPCQSQDQNVRISFGIFKPQEGCNINDAVAHMAKVAANIEKSHNINVAILKCLDRQWAAVFAVGKNEVDSQMEVKSELNLPEASVFTKGLKCAVRIVDTGWFQLTSQQTSKGVPYAQISLGDIISVRRIYCRWKTQDKLSYSCLAIMKSYFSCFGGLFSYTFYDSLDGKQIIGLGVWDRIESALAVASQPNKNPALSYWQQLGAKKLKYHVCQVVHATSSTHTTNSRPGFRI